MTRVRYLMGPSALSVRTQKAFQLAHQEAQRLNHTEIGPEHLLLGLAKEGMSLAAISLRELGFDLSWLRAVVEQINPPRPATSATPGLLQYSDKLETLLQDIVAAAEASGLTPLTPEYVLAVLVDDNDGVVVSVLRHRRFALWQLRRRLRRGMR